MVFVCLGFLIIGNSTAAGESTATKFVRLLSFGNSQNYWNSYTEIGFPDAGVSNRDVKATAGYHDGNPPGNAMDGDLQTRWSSHGVGQWIQFEFPAPIEISEIGLATYIGNQRQTLFVVQESTDGITWRSLHLGLTSGTTLELETVRFDATSVDRLKALRRATTTEQGFAHAVRSAFLPVSDDGALIRDTIGERVKIRKAEISEDADSILIRVDEDPSVRPPWAMKLIFFDGRRRFVHSGRDPSARMESVSVEDLPGVATVFELEARQVGLASFDPIDLVWISYDRVEDGEIRTTGVLDSIRPTRGPPSLMDESLEAPSNRPTEILSKASPTEGWMSHFALGIQDLVGYGPVTDAEHADTSNGIDDTVGSSGFFRAEKIGERWWLIDPDGHLFLHKGVCNVTPGATESRKEAFDARFGTPERWAEETTLELRALGFNGTGAWTDVDLLRNVTDPLIYTRHINFLRPYAREREKYGYKIGREHLQPGDWEYLNEFIFAFDPEFEEFCDRRARALADFRDEKYLLGYFSDNELGLQIDQLDRCLAMDERDPARIAAEEWLLERKSAKALPEEITAEDRDAFLGYVAERYYSQVARAMKKYDPNHLYLGSRIHTCAKDSPAFLKAAGRYVDVVSVNYYHLWTPDLDQMGRWTEWSDRPFLISEFYTKGMDTGMPNTSGSGWIVKTQEDRGSFYQNFVLTLLQANGCVGWHWFKYMDNDPNDQTADPSNRDSNKGLMNNQYDLYVPLTKKMQELNSQVYRLVEFFDG